MEVATQDSPYYEIWEIDNLEKIGNHEVLVKGNPEVVRSEIGPAVRFDGDGDMLIVNANPIGESKEFTVEIIFKPDTFVSANRDPRFVHIQDPDDPQNKRVMMELRINEQDQCYFDGYLLTDLENLTLVDETLVHPTGQWLHAAITYENGVFKTFMDGIEELSGRINYGQIILGNAGLTSIGARMDERNWYRGLIKSLKITHAALTPEEFLLVQNNYYNRVRNE